MTKVLALEVQEVLELEVMTKPSEMILVWIGKEITTEVRQFTKSQFYLH